MTDAKDDEVLDAPAADEGLTPEPVESAAPERPVALARRIVMGLAVVWVASLLVVVALRVGFAMELEWMEGGVLHQAARFARGDALYPEPSEAFVPFLYTPLYPAVLGVLGTVFPLDFALGRAVSIIATVASGWALASAVCWEGKPRAHAVIGVGLFVSGWVFSYRWLDLARPDALYLALTAWGLVLLRRAKGSHRRALWAGLLIALAFWTKQTAASFILASGLGALVVAPRQLPTYVATVALVDGGGVLLGNAMTDGWLWTYIYELHQAHTFNRERFTTKTWGMFVHAAPFAVLVAVGIAARLGGRWRRRAATPAAEANPQGLSYWTVIAIAGLLVSALGYSTQWAEPNAFIPGVYFGALLIAVALPVGGAAEVAALVVLGLQLAFAYVVEPRYQPVQKDGIAGLSKSYVWHDPRQSVPTKAQRRRARRMRERLAGASGEVLALNRPWWSVIAGGQGHVGSMGLTDIPPQTRAEIQGALRKRVRQREYAEIWLEGEPPVWLQRDLRRHYRVQRRLQRAERVRPMSGWMSQAGTIGPYRRDQIQLLPKGERSRDEDVHVIADFEDGRLDGFEVTGRAFGRRPVQGKSGKLPMAGPYGGEYLLCSAGRAGRLLDTGEAVSPVIELPQGGALEMLVGSAGRRRGLSVQIVRADGEEQVSLKIPKGRNRLATVRWEIDATWAGAEVVVRLEDAAPDGALYFDDLWLTSARKKPAPPK